jgi:hypothetical protein
MNVLKNFVIKEVGAPIAAANNTDSNSDRIDMANYEGAVFICPITDSVQGGVAALTIEQNTVDSDTGMAALSGAVDSATSAENDDLNDTLLVVEVYRPRERYIQAVRTSTTANIAFGNVIAILYGAKKRPVTLDATVQDGTLVASPIEA